jgi:4-amino-4-deoxy-L-arabinose transferase-like glycosyltransferase
VIAFALVVFGANLSVSQMRGDSIVYSAVSKNLLMADDPLVPSLNGQPYLNKPPLYFWLGAAVMGVVGTGAVGAKLGALLASTALCVLIYRGVRALLADRAAGVLAVLVFSATLVAYRNTYHARMESLVALFVLGSVLCFWRWLETPRSGWIASWGVLAGLAVLTKGPVGLLPVLAGPAYLLVRERDRLRPVPLMFGLLCFVASFLWWYLYAATRTDLLRVMIAEQWLSRGVWSEGQALHRWWSVYLAKLLSYDLIWMAAAVYGVRQAWRVESLRRPVGLLLSAASIHLVMIHLVGEKSARYLYQFYAFTAGLSAFGILAWRRFDPEPVLKLVLVVFAIGLQFVPLTSDSDYFGPLQRVVELSERSGWPVVADHREFERLDERAALDYYLDATLPPDPLPDRFIAVMPAAHPIDGATVLWTTGRLWVGLVDAENYGPGPVAPLHAPETGGSR